MTGCRISKITMTEHQAHCYASYCHPDYSEDVLKSIYDGDYAIRCSTGGFHMVKLIRNSERGFCSLIEEEWKIERQNAELKRTGK